MSRPFAAFDIDGTIIRWQLYHAVVETLGKQGCLQADDYQAIRAARMTWKNRSNPDAFREYEMELVRIYHSALTELRVEDYEKAVEETFELYKDQVYVYTRDLIRQLKNKGYFLIAISGSHKEIIEKLAAYYGFGAAAGAEYERQNGKFTGKGSTTIHGKDSVLRQLVEKHGLDHTGSIAVGDSNSDIPLLAAVENPIAFNPNQGLFRHAKDAGWKIVVERKNMYYELEKGHGSTYILAQTNAG